MDENITLNKLSILLRKVFDGEWHGLVELEEATDLPENVVIDFMKLLVEFGLAEFDESSKRIKVKEEFVVLLKEK